MKNEIVCIPVMYPDGEIVYIPAQEFYTNPPEGTYRVKYKKQIPEPVVCEIKQENWIKQPESLKRRKFKTYGTQNWKSYPIYFYDEAVPFLESDWDLLNDKRRKK